ncbi:MAG TPA: bifunctional riboflavin kinase/FAD synthetase [Solirubrobacteraceae bacterium]|nr:bifunctional riboflavin kinase/FAD synthetase [Solirubrobacteraceae bacterium]
MRITQLLDAEPRPRQIAVGEFDGVHLGHRQVIAGNDTVLTFEPHPRQVVRPEAAPRLLTSLEVKAELIAGLGVEELVVIPFDESFAAQSPQEFIDDVLVGRLQAAHVSVGENFRFGHRAAGDPEILAADGRFGTRMVPLVEVDGEVVSSSHIRALVGAGEVDVAAKMLGAPFQMRGDVVTGDRRGHTLGFPTANLVPDEKLIYPGHGVYVGRADGMCAAINVGVRPTFGTGRAVLVEAYVLDRDLDFYGHRLRVEFLNRLRGERRFDSVEALVEQMHRDVGEAREQCG